MGPGSIHLLEADWASDVAHIEGRLIFLLPNAVLARHAIDAALRTRRTPTCRFSTPQQRSQDAVVHP